MMLPKNLAFAVLLSLCLTGTSAQRTESTACYSLNLAFTWQEPTPIGEHFSPPVVVAFDPSAPLFELNTSPTPGIQLMAELGQASTLVSELRARDGAVMGDVHTGGVQRLPFPPAGETITNICLSETKSSLGVFTMIAPSPDWFIYASFSPFTGSSWMPTASVVLGASQEYDAGSDSGLDFTSGNAATPAGPQRVITRLANAGNTVTALTGPVGILTITRTSVTPRDGGWSEWIASTSCSSSCRTGTLTEVRQCNSPAPILGGLNCIGDSSRTVRCNTNVPCPGDACYRLAMQFSWIEQGGIAADNEHFSPPVVAVSSDANPVFVGIGGTASMGLEVLAETGNPSPFVQELHSQGSVQVHVGSPSFRPFEGPSVINDICLSPTESVVQIFTMVAPSPDWFIYASFRNLRNTQNNEWVPSAEIVLAPANVYDAGTDEGQTFLSDDAEQLPQGTVELLSSSGNAITSLEGPIGTFTIMRTDSPPTGWSAWGAWTPCTSTCNGGRRSRTRSCNSQTPQVDCVGEQQEDADCNSNVRCPGDICYTVSYLFSWDEVELPVETLSPPVIVAHPTSSPAFAVGSAPSAGLEILAETGAPTTFAEESRQISNSLVKVGPPSSNSPTPYQTEIVENVCLNDIRDRLSIFSMFAPSPDWFFYAGVEALRGVDGVWTSSRVVTLSSGNTYDAGGDAGTTFDADDSDEPQNSANRIVQLLPPTTIAEPIGTITITRTTTDVYGSWSGFTQCSSMCRGGTRQRTRTCIAPPCANGDTETEYDKCNKDVPCPGEVCYTLTFSPSWIEATDVAGHNEHFSPPVVVVHAPGDIDQFFPRGGNPSPGLEQLSETGSPSGFTSLLSSIDNLIFSVGSAAWPPYKAQTIDGVCVTAARSQVSFFTMIAPSPDWIIMAEVDMQTSTASRFYTTREIVLSASNEYDVGGDGGLSFLSDDVEVAADSPNRMIQLLANAQNTITALNQPTGSIEIELYRKCCNPMEEPGMFGNAECGSQVPHRCCPVTGTFNCNNECPVFGNGGMCPVMPSDKDDDDDDDDDEPTRMVVNFNNYGSGSCGGGW
eukprot:TRINITY_DN67435_c6_g1_i1.p1 TRINITY_DN67435_c6_g1~~TRINITY_DN67435_c6_g1_i1.p1  ORF type:complete len:1060 (-),score=118.60 TRINITY_DN67435_c6_g1_i1:313-3492(-)